jgi:hypothetical protein
MLFTAACLVWSSSADADYALFDVPGTRLRLLIEGQTVFNAGGTITLKHPRGTLYFSRNDLKIVRTKNRRAIFGRKSRELLTEKSVDNYLELANWALEHGMLKECKSLLSSAWKADPSDKKIQKLAGLMQYINRTVPSDPDSEAKLRDLVGGSRMVISRSKHFALLHDPKTQLDPVTKKTRAQMRLDLMETVYESYFLAFALRGFYLRPPTKPLNVVLFSEHKNFILMEKRLEMGLRQVAGFYLPKENAAFFYDSGTTEGFLQLKRLSDDLNKQVEAAKRIRAPGTGDLVRFSKTLALLVDIQRESEDVATVSHEAVHQLAANTGLFPRDAIFIRWIHEGLASFFESAKMARWSGVGVVDSNRIDYYRALEGDPQRGSIEFIVSDLGFVVETVLGNQLPAYGQAWALTHFLFQKRFDGLIQFYGKTRSLPPDTPPREKAEKLLEIFDECFGDRVKLELEWRRYMRTLRTDIERLAEDSK